ncbi:hypothetical protein BJ742DRAFT_770420 [Cladochytrium replicatum]|nr:hypothetical protein BJ742DRAFT_770420 [Cladochytrium replicatum]
MPLCTSYTMREGTYMVHLKSQTLRIRDYTLCLRKTESVRLLRQQGGLSGRLRAGFSWSFQVVALGFYSYVYWQNSQVSPTSVVGNQFEWKWLSRGQLEGQTDVDVVHALVKDMEVPNMANIQ